MNLLADIDLKNPLTFSEAIPYGLKMVMIGMGTVFSVLITILVTLIIFKYVFHDLPAKKASKQNEMVIEQPTPVVAPYVHQDEEIVAVIAAAIAMAESECNGIKFKVVSFKRK